MTTINKADTITVYVAEKTYVFSRTHVDRDYINASYLSETYKNDGGNTMASYWRSKRLDFSDQFPQYVNEFKTLDRIQIEYVDEIASTPVTVYISTDGGVTWIYKTISLGTGDGKQKSQDFYFHDKESITSRFFNVKLESMSSTTNFTWTGIFLFFEPRGEWFSV